MTAPGIRRLPRRFAGPVARRLLLVALLAAAWAGWHLGPWWPLTRWSRPSKSVGVAILSPNGTSVLAIEQRESSGFLYRYDSFRLWDLVSGREMVAVAGGVGQEQAFAPDGSWLAAHDGNGDIAVWDTADGHVRFTIPPAGGQGGVEFHRRPFTVSPDGRTLACRAGDREGVELWDLSTGRLAAIVDGAMEPVAFAPGGRALAAVVPPGGGQPTRILHWDVAQGREIGHFTDGSFDQPHSLVFSPDGRRLAVETSSWLDGMTRSRTTVTMRDWPSGQVRATVTAEFDHRWFAARGRWPPQFSPDGRFLVIGGEGTGLFWDLSTDPLRNLDHLLADTRINPDGPPNSITYPRFNPPGNRFLVPGSEPLSWVIHDTATLAPLATCRATGLALQTPVISPDGRWMAFLAGGSLARPPAWQVWLARLLGQPDTFFRPRGHARLIDLTTGAEAGRVYCGTTLLGFSPDSRSLWSYSQSTVLEVEQWAVPSPWPPLWLVAVTALGVVLAAADWRRSRRRAVIIGA